MDAKEAAARKAVEYVKDGMTLGIGSGSTAAWAIKALGERVAQEGLKIQGVPTSQRSAELARDLHIPLIELDGIPIDLTIDGADEVDAALNLIKGGGGALLREKLVAVASAKLLIICDESKIRPVLGAFPLPVAIVPFGWETTVERLKRFCPDVRLRLKADSSPFVSDDSLYIADMHLGRILDPLKLEQNLKATPGVAEVGLFMGLTSHLVIGYEDGHVEERIPVH